MRKAVSVFVLQRPHYEFKFCVTRLSIETDVDLFFFSPRRFCRVKGSVWKAFEHCVAILDLAWELGIQPWKQGFAHLYNLKDWVLEPIWNWWSLSEASLVVPPDQPKTSGCVLKFPSGADTDNHTSRWLVFTQYEVNVAWRVNGTIVIT